MAKFSRSAVERVAENKIQEAIEQGSFDHLPGAGKPIEGLDKPFDENWWVRKWIERERLKRLDEERSRLKREPR